MSRGGLFAPRACGRRAQLGRVSGGQDRLREIQPLARELVERALSGCGGGPGVGHARSVACRGGPAGSGSVPGALLPGRSCDVRGGRWSRSRLVVTRVHVDHGDGRREHRHAGDGDEPGRPEAHRASATATGTGIAQRDPKQGDKADPERDTDRVCHADRPAAGDERESGRARRARARSGRRCRRCRPGPAAAGLRSEPGDGEARLEKSGPTEAEPGYHRAPRRAAGRRPCGSRLRSPTGRR